MSDRKRDLLHHFFWEKWVSASSKNVKGFDTA